MLVKLASLAMIALAANVYIEVTTASAADSTKATLYFAQSKTTDEVMKKAPALQPSTKSVGPSGPATGTTGGRPKAVALTTGDCWAVGGTVVTVTDGRCGASGQYCRLKDTNAVCIDKAN